MGWLWSSTASESASAPAHVPLSPIDNEAQFPSNVPMSQENDSPETRGAKEDTEFNAYLSSFAVSEPSPSQPDLDAGQTSQSQSQSHRAQRTDHDRIRADGSLNISPAALHPRTMSCRQAFDQAFYCQSIGGKFNDVYRHGRLQDCGEQWGAFWFCMRTRTLPSADKEESIRQYYAERDERRRKTFGSSEDVWDLREKPVQRAFWKDPDAREEVQVKDYDTPKSSISRLQIRDIECCGTGGVHDIYTIRLWQSASQSTTSLKSPITIVVDSEQTGFAKYR